MKKRITKLPYTKKMHECDSKMKKLLKLAKSIGALDYCYEQDGNTYAIISSHRAKIEKYSAETYLRLMRESNNICAKDIGCPCCINKSMRPDKSMCKTCKLNSGEE